MPALGHEPEGDCNWQPLDSWLNLNIDETETWQRGLCSAFWLTSRYPDPFYCQINSVSDLQYVHALMPLGIRPYLRSTANTNCGPPQRYETNWIRDWMRSKVDWSFIIVYESIDNQPKGTLAGVGLFRLLTDDISTLCQKILTKTQRSKLKVKAQRKTLSRLEGQRVWVSHGTASVSGTVDEDVHWSLSKTQTHANADTKSPKYEIWS